MGGSHSLLWVYATRGCGCSSQQAVAPRHSRLWQSDTRFSGSQTVERGCARQSSDCLPPPQTSLFYQTILRKIYACFWCMGWSRAMLSSALPRCSLMHPSDAPSCTRAMLSLAPRRCSLVHQGDALSCTKSNRAYRLILEEVFPRLEGKLSRASTGDLPARRREDFPQGEGKTSRKAKGDLHPTAARLFY